jgi:hypothetical protein
MASIVTLIDEIKSRPAMYLGRRSLSCLRSFLDGWCYRDKEEPCDASFFRGFHEWVERKYGQKDTQSWDRIILFYSQDEADALDRFFKLFDEYRHERARSCAG